MTSTNTTQPSRLLVLDGLECWRLISSRPIGRLAWSGSHGVTVLPVNFRVVEAEDASGEPGIVLRTSPYSLMARDAAERDVAFEVDEIDESTHTGWSVLVRGRTRREAVTTDGPSPWATGPRTLGLHIDVTEVSGRRLEPPTRAVADQA